MKGNITAEHGDVDVIINGLLNFANIDEDEKKEIGLENLDYANAQFSPAVLKLKMLEVIQN